jgi:hypothetical protein
MMSGFRGAPGLADVQERKWASLLPAGGPESTPRRDPFKPAAPSALKLRERYRAPVKQQHVADVESQPGDIHRRSGAISSYPRWLRTLTSREDAPMLDDKLRVVACPRATFRACRRRFVDPHRLDPGTHGAPPQQIQAEPARDGDEPCQNQSLRIESLEMDDGSHERVLSEVLGFGGSEQTPTETEDRPMTAEPQHLSPGAPLGAARVRCQRGSR